MKLIPVAKGRYFPPGHPLTRQRKEVSLGPHFRPYKSWVPSKPVDLGPIYLGKPNVAGSVTGNMREARRADGKGGFDDFTLPFPIVLRPANRPSQDFVQSPTGF
jgi:hypothetical protein